MPLHGPHKARLRPPEGLYQAIWRDSHSLQARRQFAHRLVVVAVHGVLARADRRGQRRHGQDLDAVDRHVVGRLAVMLDLRGALRRQVLPQRAAKQGVYHLDAAADAQHRQVALDRARQQRSFHGVARGAGLPHQSDGCGVLLAIDCGRHVLAAGDEQAVADR